MGILTCAICLGLIYPQPGTAASPSIKTSFKRYAVYPYKDRKVMCERYQVAKDDWLYKIFRQKGEISEKDFPLFLAMFKFLNPGISNIDAINPGQRVLIPLKMVSGKDFDKTTPGVVEVPVIEFSTHQEKLSPRYRKHQVKKGDTVSQLMDPVFLNRDGTLTPQGLALFTLANPGVSRPDRIQEGRILNLPLPRSQESSVPAGPVSSATLTALKKYSRMHHGQLLESGKYYFPSKKGSDQVLDLAYTPLIKFKNGSRTIMVPEKSLYQTLAAAIRAFWSDVTLVEIKTALEATAAPSSAEGLSGAQKATDNHEIPRDHRLAAKRLVEHAGFEYTPDAVIGLEVGTLDLDIKVGKISRPGKPDLFVEYGEVYGFALDRIHDKGYELISLFPNETTRQIAVKLFTALGIQVVENPAFISTRTDRTVSIPGIYIPTTSGEIILLDGDLDLETADFLREKNISLLHMDLPDSGASPW
jgi:hypothetical protein